MKQNISFDAGMGKEAAGKLQANRLFIENDKNRKGLAYLKVGQQITGTVVSVGQQITLNLGGQEVITTNAVLKGVVPGDVKTFDIVKANKNEIELKLVQDFGKTQSFVAKLSYDKNLDTIQEQKASNSRQLQKEKEVQASKAKLEEISSKLTEKDYELLEKEGFPLDNFSISGLSDAIDRIKANGNFIDKFNNVALEADQFANQDAGGVPTTSLKNKDFGDSLTGERISYNKFADNKTAKEKPNNKSTLEDKIKEHLKEANLPVTIENLQKITTALNQSNTVSLMNASTMRYLIAQELEPTIGNIYKAHYSSDTGRSDQVQPLSQKAWVELQPRAKEVIREAGYEINEKSLKDAKWLIENQLPLTRDSFTYKKELEKIKEDTNPDKVLDYIVEDMKKGIAPNDASLTRISATTYEKLLRDIDFIKEDTVSEAVKGNVELTIKNLVTLQEMNSAVHNTNDNKAKDTIERSEENKLIGSEKAVTGSKEINLDTSDANNLSDKNPTDAASDNESGNPSEEDYRIKEIKAKRQLEEIRLKMTLEAAARLDKKGFSIDTQPLERVVNELRELENQYYKRLLKEADIDASFEQIQVLQETTESIDQLRYTPSFVLGVTLSERRTQTIPDLLAAGNHLQAELKKAGIAYDTLMTVPNREYGDSLQKAFQNMDALLTELKLENTEQNLRALRILGYNRMEMTEDAINRVKAYDFEVNTLLQKLHPAVTVRIIKEGINPLAMPIHELNQVIDKMTKEQGISSEEKFSTFLRKLEKDHEISQEERNAYIGIYRLLYNIEKSDGAALGSVIHAGREVTLENLLSAVRTHKKGSLDAVIDDDFGTLESISHKGDSISKQLELVLSGKNDTNSSNQDETREKTEYLDQILQSLKEELSPEKLKELKQQLAGNAQLLQTATSHTPLAASEHGIWETLKNVPAEKLLEQIRNMKEAQAAENEVYTQKVQQLQELSKNTDQSIRFLNDFKLPSTPFHLTMVSHILSNGESPIKRLLKLQNENIVEKTENSLKEMEEVSDTLVDKNSMNETYEKLKKDAKTALEHAYSEEKLDPIKLAELKSIGNQMTFLRTLASREFYQIPIETVGGITNMNLTVVHTSSHAGKVSITYPSEQLGNVRADFILKEQSLKGFISCDNRNGLEVLHRHADEIEQKANENGINVKQLDFGIQARDMDAYSYQNTDKETEGTSMSTDTERQLYCFAKTMVQLIRAAEKDWSSALTG
jgi:hypothetical protein